MHCCTPEQAEVEELLDERRLDESTLDEGTILDEDERLEGILEEELDLLVAVEEVL